MLKKYQLSDIQHKVYGRTTSSLTPLTLFWTGSGIELNVAASELFIEFETDYDVYEQWIGIFINGALISRQMLNKGKQQICVFRCMNSEKVKNVRIVKEVQAMSAENTTYLQIHSVLTDGQFYPVEDKELKIEVIGDSITSGEGTIGAQGEEDWISMIFSASHNYGFMLGQKLDADVRIISQSGWGILSSWDNNPHCAIPPIYDKVCGLVYGDHNASLGAQDDYDFSTWQPNVIVVNLGTNDGSAFIQPEWKDETTGEHFEQLSLEDGSFEGTCVKRLEDAIIAFLHKLHAHNPNAKILWVYGMLGNPMKDIILHAITSYQKENADTFVDFLELPDTTDETVGSRFHPGVPAHKKAAELISTRISAYSL